MSVSHQYELLDFGAGRKLERFGPWVVDRPSPAALDSAPKRPELWSKAAARYERNEGQRGAWSRAADIAAAWQISCGPFRLELRLTDWGQVGLFPEQADNWSWIGEQVRAAKAPVKVLNLFAYTGASTLAAAAAGAEVTHLDAAAGVVAWARRNAQLSGLGDAPIRWITEDARKFVRRELKRGNRYDAVILDPPGYGHGPGGEAWKLEEHLGDLLAMCGELTAGGREFFLLTCHSGELAYGPALLKYTIAHLPGLRGSGRLSGADLRLRSANGSWLHSGAAVRFSRHETPSAAQGAAKPAER
jgi:23S rRNA (cytosine1962-C5)-methyltransferase